MRWLEERSLLHPCQIPSFFPNFAIEQDYRILTTIW
jgi:hypothetical protein